MTAPDKPEIVSLYRKRAKHYDFTANLYYLIGFREWAYRKMAVEALSLEPGDTVVEVGCGTGLNFSLLESAVGPEGKIVGVDLTDEMLAQAAHRVQERGWENVALVQSDAAAYEFPSSVSGIISTYALSLIPEHEQVIRNGAGALAPGSRWVVSDLKIPSNRLARLTPFLVPLVRPFGATRGVLERHLLEAMRRHLDRVSVRELYFGISYIASGEAKG